MWNRRLHGNCYYENYKVTALARRKYKLNRLFKETSCDIISLDIRKNKEIEKLKKFKFDILVNNAGLGRFRKNL